MRRLIPFLATLLVAAGLAALAGAPADLPAFSPAEPELHLAADGSSLVFLHRAEATGEPDVAAAALLLAEARNPGLLRAFARHVFATWLADGLVGLDPEGRVVFAPEDKPALEARLRLAVALDLAPYLREVTAAAEPAFLDALAIGPMDPDPALVAALPEFAAPWYSSNSDSRTPLKATWAVWCEPCQDLTVLSSVPADVWRAVIHTASPALLSTLLLVTKRS